MHKLTASQFTLFNRSEVTKGWQRTQYREANKASFKPSHTRTKNCILSNNSTACKEVKIAMVQRESVDTSITTWAWRPHGYAL